MKSALVLTAAVFFAGCATSSGVLQAGPNAYTVTAQASFGRGDLPAARRMAYSEAEQKCKASSQIAHIDSEEGEPTNFIRGMANASIKFHCVTP